MNSKSDFIPTKLFGDNNGCIPLSHNSVQSHNSIHFLLYTCLTSLIKDSGSLHSALVMKIEICGKNRFFSETYLINDQNVNISPIQMQDCIFDHTSSKFIQKKVIKLLASSPVNKVKRP